MAIQEIGSINSTENIGFVNFFRFLVSLLDLFVIKPNYLGQCCKGKHGIDHVNFSFGIKQNICGRVRESYDPNQQVKNQPNQLLHVTFNTEISPAEII